MGHNGLTRGMAAEDRFFARVAAGPGCCWVWTGALRGHRYAQIMVEAKTVMAHRWAYERWNGPIGEGLQVDHICGVTRCVNPAHLRAITARENVLAHWREQRGTCRNGHPITDTSARWRLGGTVRRCHKCERARQSRYRKAVRLRKKVT